MYLYLDECYNTGNNWLDKNQLFFTYGGWLISEDNLPKAELIIQDFSQHHQGELKSKSFTSHKGIREVINLSNRLISDCNAKPYFMCFEKHFMIACKVVEFFFDHKINKRVNGFLTFPNEYEYYRITCLTEKMDISYDLAKMFLPPINITKRGLAEVIKRDESFCTYIGEIINGKYIDESCIINIIHSLKSIFSQAGFENIAYIFEESNFKLGDICDELQSDTITSNGKLISKSILVQPSIYEMIYGIKDEHKNLKIIVDTLGDQNCQFSEISNLLNIPIDIRDDSKSDMMIMASDLLIGQFARLIKDISTGSNDISEYDIELIKYSFTPKKSTFQEDLSYWFGKFSYDTWMKLSISLGIKIDAIDYIGVLKNEFQQFVK
jgi:hypothetical protein